MKKIIVCLLLTIFTIHAQNPTYICNDCGVFDLSKVTFNENPDTLTSKLKTRRTVYVGKQLIEKWERDILPNDTIISFTISERGSSNKKRATYANLFEFNTIDILAPLARASRSCQQ